jgi:hypothetical protein
MLAKLFLMLLLLLRRIIMKFIVFFHFFVRNFRFRFQHFSYNFLWSPLMLRIVCYLKILFLKMLSQWRSRKYCKFVNSRERFFFYFTFICALNEVSNFEL